MSNKTFKKVSVIKLSTNFGEATKVVEVKLIPPEDNQVLLKVIYAGVNATDINITAGRYFTDGKLPFDIGLEAIGVVEAVGKNVTKVKAGDPAVALGGRPKAYAEYLYLTPEEVIPLPALKPEFIGLLVCGLTVTIGLDESGRIKSGETVLITAAAGGTGHIGVQWAKQRGCHVIGTTSSKDKEQLLKELGCDRVINYKEESIDEVLTKEYPKGIDVVWETIGGEVFETLFKHLSIRGRLIIVGGITGYKSGVGMPQVSLPNLPSTLLMQSKTLSGFLLSNYRELFEDYLKNLIKLVLSDKLRVVLDFGQNTSVGQFEGINSVVRGVEYLHSGRNTGKVVIKIQNK